MKKCLIIFSIIFAVFLTAFIISVVVTGASFASNVGVNGIDFINFAGALDAPITEVAPHKSFSGAFNDEVKGIKVKVANANTTIRVEDVSEVKVNYTAGDTLLKFGADVKNGILLVNEQAPGFIFGMNLNGERSELTIVLPGKVYDTAKLEIAAGEMNVDGLECSVLEIETGSGSGRYNVFAEKIKTNVASGDIRVVNCTENKARSIDINAASGGTTFSGFLADSFNAEVASGSVELTGISGAGTIDAASGVITLNYAEWDNDLSIEAASGHIDITLPEGSGASVDLGALSGGVKCELDGETDFLEHNDHAQVGGDNVHDIDIELLSGNVRIHN